MNPGERQFEIHRFIVRASALSRESLGNLHPVCEDTGDSGDLLAVVNDMIVRKASSPPHRSIAELFHDLGDIPLERIRARPAPGTATLEDAIEAECCELIDGVLVEKTMGLRESMLAVR